MKKILKYLAIILLSLTILLVGGAYLVSRLFHEEIKTALLDKLNKQLLTEVSINGPIDITFFKHFPEATLVVQDLHVKGSIAGNDSALLKAGKTDLLVNVFDLVQQEWNIHSIVIADGELNLLRLKDGTTNYRLVEDNPDKKADSLDFLIDVRQAELHNIHFTYTDLRSDILIDLNVAEAALTGNFSSDELNISAVGDLYSNSLKMIDIDYLSNKQVKLEGGIQINTDQNTYALNLFDLAIEKNHFDIAGDIDVQDDKTLLNLDVNGKDLTINNTYQLLPERFRQPLEAFDAQGQLAFKGKIEGEVSAKKNPKITVNYDISGATLKHSSLHQPVEGLSFQGYYTNGWGQKLASSTVSFKNIQAQLGNQTFSADFKITNLVNPEIEASLDGAFDLGLLNGYITDQSIKDLSGVVTAKDFKAKGKIAEFKKNVPQQLPDMSGTMDFWKAAFKWDTSTIIIENGSLAFNKQEFRTPNGIDLNINDQRYHLEGGVSHLPEYLIALNRNEKPAIPLEIAAVIKTSELRMDNMLALQSGGQNKNSDTAAGLSFEGLTHIKGKVWVFSNYVEWGRFKAHEFDGKVSFAPGKIDLTDMNMKTMGGKIELKTTLRFDGNKVSSESFAKCDNIKVDELFYQLDDFLQDEITHEHLSGRLTAGILVNADFIDGELDTDNLYAFSDLTLKDGALVNYEPLEAMSKFVAIEELRNLQFSTLQNQIEIKEGTIHIPEMIIQTNALNLMMAGTHTLDNYVDYQIKVNIMEILGKKIRKRKVKLVDLEPVGEDNFNLFLTIQGPIDDLSIKYDKRSVKEKFKGQGEEIKDAIHNNYDEYNPQQENEDWETDDELQFLDWDETQ